MKNSIKEYLTEEKYHNNDLNFCKNSVKPLVIMPAGQQAVSFYNYLKAHSVKIAFFVDNDPQKHGTKIDGVSVISFEKYKELYSDLNLVIATNEIIEALIINQIKEGGSDSYFYPIETDYYCFNAVEIDSAYELIIKDLEVFSDAYSLFNDDLSKETFINLLNYRITNNNCYLKVVARPQSNQYLEPDIYAVTPKDHFVDCGAFDGDTLKAVMSVVGNNLAAYYGFEPDLENFIKLENVAGNYSNMHLKNVGVFKENTVLRFESSSNSLSRIVDDDGGVELKVVALDSIMDSKTVSMIKMDIEGGEYDALLGAQKIITEQGPTLAISVYHKFDDLYKLLLLIESFGTNYTYFLRHYTLKSAETVLYCVKSN